MATINYSLSSFKIGVIAADGGMSTALEELGINKVVRNVANITQQEGTVTTFDLEIEDDPIASINTPGTTDLTVDLYVTDGRQLERLFGGTYTPAVTGASAAPETYDFPRKQVEKEVSVEMVHKNGAKFQVPRMKLVARFEWAFRRDALAIIHITGTALLPDKTDIGPYKYIGPPAS